MAIGLMNLKYILENKNGGFGISSTTSLKKTHLFKGNTRLSFEVMNENSIARLQ
jgi:hypothetical protein